MFLFSLNSFEEYELSFVLPHIQSHLQKHVSPDQWDGCGAKFRVPNVCSTLWLIQLCYSVHWANQKLFDKKNRACIILYCLFICPPYVVIHQAQKPKINMCSSRPVFLKTKIQIIFETVHSFQLRLKRKKKYKKYFCFSGSMVLLFSSELERLWMVYDLNIIVRIYWIFFSFFSNFFIC